MQRISNVPSFSLGMHLYQQSTMDFKEEYFCVWYFIVLPCA